MVGALGTLGVLGELTLRLHPEPEFEATWLAVFTDVAAAQAFVARLVDSTVQPSRVEFLNRAGLAACGAGDGPAAVAVSIGTAEEAVRAQGETVARFAREAGAWLRPLGASFWAAHAEATALDGAIVLSVGTLVTLVGETAAETERAVAAAGAAATITAAATLGSLRAAFPAMEPRALRTLVERLRAFVAPGGGGVIIQRAPAAVLAAADPSVPVLGGGSQQAYRDLAPSHRPLSRPPGVRDLVSLGLPLRLPPRGDARPAPTPRTAPAAALPGPIHLCRVPGAGPRGCGVRALASLSAVGAPASRAVHGGARALPAARRDGGTARRRAAGRAAPGALPGAR